MIIVDSVYTVFLYLFVIVYLSELFLFCKFPTIKDPKWLFQFEVCQLMKKRIEWSDYLLAMLLLYFI